MSVELLIAAADEAADRCEPARAAKFWRAAARKAAGDDAALYAAIAAEHEAQA